MGSGVHATPVAQTELGTLGACDWERLPNPVQPIERVPPHRPFVLAEDSTRAGNYGGGQSSPFFSPLAGCFFSRIRSWASSPPNLTDYCQWKGKGRSRWARAGWRWERGGWVWDGLELLGSSSWAGKCNVQAVGQQPYSARSTSASVPVSCGSHSMARCETPSPVCPSCVSWAARVQEAPLLLLMAGKCQR